MPRDASRTATFIVPGHLDTRTGGSIYDRQMVEGLRRIGWHVDVIELPADFPFPMSATLTGTAQAFAGIADNALAVVDGLVFSAIPDIVSKEAARLRLVALVHLPLAADVTLDRNVIGRVESDERRALSAATAVVVTGSTTLGLLQRYALDTRALAVVEPGTLRGQVSRGSNGVRVELLTVATLHPGKGHEMLLEALAALPHRRWHLTCAGSLTRHPDTVGRVGAAVQRLGIGANVTLTGELDEPQLAQCYATTDLFVLATLQETFGMAVAEALAHGVPVISTATGAIPDLIGQTAGIVVPPGDGSALAGALQRVMGEDGAELRARFRDGARAVRDRLPSWEHAVHQMSDVLDRVHAHG